MFENLNMEPVHDILVTQATQDHYGPVSVGSSLYAAFPTASSMFAR